LGFDIPGDRLARQMQIWIMALTDGFSVGDRSHVGSSAKSKARACEHTAMPLPLPVLNGVCASTLQLPAGTWKTVLDALCDHFTAIGRDEWLHRIARGRVLDAQGMPIADSTPYRVGVSIHYYREVACEARVPFTETILHADDHLVVVDKPHFLAVIPGGRHVEETLLARLIQSTGNQDLVPLHRLDLSTAGVLLFSASRQTRGGYQALFSHRRITKCYETLAPALRCLEFPLTYKSRLVRGEPFFRMREAPGAPNSETRIDVIAQEGEIWRYALRPISGRKHQLRVHMAALGAAIVNDPLYPALATERAWTDDGYTYTRPLKLVARSLAFVDPVNGRERCFISRMEL
jgi:tRNA pseudouridine32 synthase/23S rRNA pseudouridine746 synthase